MNVDVPASPAKGVTVPPPVMSVGQPPIANQTDPESLLIMFDEFEHRNDEDGDDDNPDQDDLPKQQPIYFK